VSGHKRTAVFDWIKICLPVGIFDSTADQVCTTLEEFDEKKYEQ
jgi:hypothetical protein